MSRAALLAALVGAVATQRSRLLSCPVLNNKLECFRHNMTDRSELKSTSSINMPEWKFSTVKNKLRPFQRNLNTVTDTTYGDYARDRSKNLNYVITPITDPRTIWHQDNLAPRTIWHRGQFGTGQFGTADNLAPRTIWHRRQFGTVK